MNKAMIFAAGIGSRLKPFTDSHPKALARVGGVPALQRVIEKLRDEAGITYMVVNVHHFANQVVDFLEQNRNFGVEIKISDESDCLLDTGGGLLKAQQLLDLSDSDAVVLHNADILTDFPIAPMIDFHRAQCANATLMVSPRQSSRVFRFDSGMNLAGWQNLKTGECRPVYAGELANSRALAFGGVHVVSPSVFNRLESYSRTIGSDVFSITPFYIDAIGHLAIKGYCPASVFRWFDIGTPEKLAAAEKEFC